MSEKTVQIPPSEPISAETDIECHCCGSICLEGNTVTCKGEIVCYICDRCFTEMLQAYEKELLSRLPE